MDTDRPGAGTAGKPAAEPGAAKRVRRPADATGFPGYLGIFGGLIACAVLLWPLGVWHGVAGGSVADFLAPDCPSRGSMPWT
jgi:hypothetical protein